MPKACAEGGLSVHGPTPCGARRFRAGMDGSVGRSLENPWSLSGGALSLRPSFFSLFSPEQQENQGRRRILDCVSGVSLREKCQSLMHTGARRENLVAANFGRILQSGLFGVAAPYRMPSRTPFADDRRKLRMDSRRFLDALGRNAGVLKRGRKADDRAASE